MQRNSRKEGPDAWQFRWSETRLDGKRLYRKKIVGTVEQYPDEGAARRAVVGLVSEINTDARPTKSRAMTVAQLCDHFEQRELSKENTWRSHATKKISNFRQLVFLPMRANPAGQVRFVELFRSSPGFALCHWRRAVVPKFET
jgi:hypothetical protein